MRPRLIPAASSSARSRSSGKTVRFANAFACNDVDSLELLWPTVATSERPVVLLNARRDRPLRTRRFLAFLAAQVPTPLLFVVGDPLAARLARRAGFGPDAVRRLRARLPDSALRELAAVRAIRRRDLGRRQLSGLRRPSHRRACRARRIVLTAALIIGVVVSLALTELVGLTPGGIIVPGYVALLLDRPLALAAFLMVALLSYGIVLALGTRLMLYGQPPLCDRAHRRADAERRRAMGWCRCSCRPMSNGWDWD